MLIVSNDMDFSRSYLGLSDGTRLVKCMPEERAPNLNNSYYYALTIHSPMGKYSEYSQTAYLQKLKTLI
jgi:hypothetical protein